MIVTALWFHEHDTNLSDMLAVLTDFTDYPRNGVGREHTYCWCFRGGTFCCVDCKTSRYARTIHNLTKPL